jgi:hypothetical protein
MLYNECFQTGWICRDKGEGGGEMNVCRSVVYRYRKLMPFEHQPVGKFLMIGHEESMFLRDICPTTIVEPPNNAVKALTIIPGSDDNFHEACPMVGAVNNSVAAIRFKFHALHSE